MLSRRNATALVLDALAEDHAVVFANGFISREGCAHHDLDRHFYMIGSMGLAAAIGLGVALAGMSARVVVVDGDGNLLMGLGVLPMVGAWQPPHFLHVVLDNGTYGSTGSQPTIASSIDFVEAARASGYREACSVENEAGFVRCLARYRTLVGPVLLHVRISAQEPDAAPRVPQEPDVIARRFSSWLGRRKEAT